MIHYVPFLKAKQGERAAMGELAPEVKSGICPLFDFPRNTPNYDEEGYGATTSRIVAGLKKHWGADSEFYFDDLDIGQTLSVEGEHQYAYVLKALYGLQVVPVVALDRINHNAAVARLKREDEIASDIVAFRAEQGDFEDFDDKEDQIDYDLANVFKEFKAIDLILDCRLCSGMDVFTTAQQIAAFSQKFCAAYPVRRVIVAGSSIPPSIRDVLGTHNVITLPRRELEIIARTSDLVDVDVVAGDYPYVDRLSLLAGLIPAGSTAIQAVYTAHAAREKTSLYARLREQFKEGIVLKNLTASYSPGKTSGSSALKYKFIESASFVVTMIHPSKRSVSLGLYAKSEILEAGNVTIPPSPVAWGDLDHAGRRG